MGKQHRNGNLALVEPEDKFSFETKYQPKKGKEESFSDVEIPSFCCVCRTESEKFNSWIGVIDDGTYVPSKIRRRTDIDPSNPSKKITVPVMVMYLQYVKCCSVACRRIFYEHSFEDRLALIASFAKFLEELREKERERQKKPNNLKSIAS